MIRRLFTDRLLPPIPIIPIPIPGTTPEWGWHGVPRDLRWGLGLAATGAIAIGTTATSTSITTIISIRTTTSTANKTVSSNTTHNTAGMLPMATEEQQIG